MANFDLIVDVDDGRLLKGFLSTLSTTPPNAVYGDTQGISVRLVESNNNDADLPWRDLDLTGQTIRVGIGNPGSKPTGGTFTITIGADTTNEIAWGATEAEVKTELDNLTVSPKDYTVEASGSGYRITYPDDGDAALLTVDTDLLTPAASATVITVRDGVAATSPETQAIIFEQDYVAYVELTTDKAAAAATITQVRTGVTDTTSEIQKVEITGDPYEGIYTLTINSEETGALEVDSASDTIKASLEALPSIGSDNVTVTGSGLSYTVVFDKSLGDVGAITADITNLLSPVGKQGEIDLTSNELLQLVDGKSSQDATLEIVRYTTSGAKSDTVFQGGITCKQDIV